MSKINYTILVSLFMVIILVIQQSPVLWPGTFFLLVQSLFLLVIHLLIKAMRERGRLQLLPVIRQFQVFFGVIFPLWILLAVTGQLATIIGRIFVLLVLLIFFALAIVLVLRLLTAIDLLDRFK